MKMQWPSGKEASREDVLGCVGPGWAGILNALIDDLFKLGWNGHVHQVKEKFGGLRFYIGGASSEIFDRIGDAEEESMETCEDCGSKEQVTTTGRGWVTTTCDPCRARHRLVRIAMLIDKN